MGLILRTAASRRPPRAPDAGAAAVEMALLLPMLTMLLLGMFDYGKYMYVGIAAQQAAREGAREMSRASVGNCATTAKVNPLIATEQGSTGAAKLFMNQIGLSTATTVTATCLTTANGVSANPTWQVSLQVDFPPLIGYMTTANLMPKGAGTTARVKAKFLMRGN
ncbi:MAG TPA: TadE/TadG family type IV pilus assembly protein [Polyangia bacterium]